MQSTRCGAASASGWLAPLTCFLGILGCAQPRLAMRWLLSLSSISAATSCCSDLQKALEAFKSCTFFVLGSETSSLKYYVQMCSHLCFSCAGRLCGQQRGLAESLRCLGRLPFNSTGAACKAEEEVLRALPAAIWCHIPGGSVSRQATG